MPTRFADDCRAARVVVPVRLPEALVARLDVLRGSRSRSAYIRGILSDVIASEEQKRSRREIALEGATMRHLEEAGDGNAAYRDIARAQKHAISAETIAHQQRRR